MGGKQRKGTGRGEERKERQRVEKTGKQGFRTKPSLALHAGMHPSHTPYPHPHTLPMHPHIQTCVTKVLQDLDGGELYPLSPWAPLHRLDNHLHHTFTTEMLAPLFCESVR